MGGDEYPLAADAYRMRRVEYAFEAPWLRCSAMRLWAAIRPAASRVCLHEA